MTASEIARKYRALQGELDCVEKQLEKLKVYDVVQGSRPAPSYEKGNKKVEGYIHGKGSVDLLAEQSSLKKQIAEIEIFIAAIPITEYREAMEMLCYKGYDFNDVGDVMRKDGDNLRRNINNYLRKLDCGK